MKAFLIQAEALFAIFTAFLAAAVVLSSIARNEIALQQSIFSSKKQLEADALADFIAVRLVDANGNVQTKAVEEIRQEKTQILLANQAYGPEPPSNSSIFLSRRLVHTPGAAAILEVRKW